MDTLYTKASTLDTIIRANGDIIDANEQETFTLQEFRQLVIEYRRQNKDFLIARVSTSDERASEQHHFYYTASEVNKILFKYETDRRLLHRIKVRNPLNNLFIVGAVVYYKVSVDEVDRAISSYYENRLNSSTGFGNLLKSNSFSTNELDDEGSDKNTNFKAKSGFLLDKRSKADNKSHVGTDEYPPEKNRPKMDKYNQMPGKSCNTLNLNKYLNISDSSPLASSSNYSEMVQSVNGSCQLLNIRDRLVYNAEYFGTDDDFLMSNEIRNYFRQNCIDDDDDFLFELDRTHADIFALLETGTDSENEDMNEWKRILSFHVSLLLTLFGIMLLLGANPLIFIIAAPVIILIFMSFICSLMYITCCRRASFNSLAVRSVEGGL